MKLGKAREPAGKENAASYTAEVDEVDFRALQREGCGHAVAKVVVTDDVQALEDLCDLARKRISSSDLIQNISERRGRHAQNRLADGLHGVECIGTRVARALRPRVVRFDRIFEESARGARTPTC